MTPHSSVLSAGMISMTFDHPRHLTEDEKHHLWGAWWMIVNICSAFSQQFSTKPHPVPFNALSRFSSNSVNIFSGKSRCCDGRDLRFYLQGRAAWHSFDLPGLPSPTRICESEQGWCLQDPSPRAHWMVLGVTARETAPTLTSPSTSRRVGAGETPICGGGKPSFSVNFPEWLQIQFVLWTVIFSFSPHVPHLAFLLEFEGQEGR